MKIIETESYAKDEKGSHSSLGYTASRAALFMPPGTIYMYYARGQDSLNFSAHGEGNGVLIKSGFPVIENKQQLALMQRLNPGSGETPRPIERLACGQTLVCKSLGLTVREWDKQTLCPERFYIACHGYHPARIIQAPRLGIPKGRDEHLLYRFIDYDYAKYCTANPLTKRQWLANRDYFILKSEMNMLI